MVLESEPLRLPIGGLVVEIDRSATVESIFEQLLRMVVQFV
jgi:hypothetical protein